MGIYLNPDNRTFYDFIRSDSYIDKTGLIRYTNMQIGKAKHLIASSRPRRFGKSLAVQMLAAYYSCGCSSKELFENLEISRDPSFQQHLNQYDVICLDIQWMKTSAMPEIKKGNVRDIISYIHQEVIRELREVYPQYVDPNAVSLPKVLADINVKTKKQFVILIDEWDCFFREDKDNTALLTEYIDFLRGMFKGQPADQFVKLAYITGILPIKKYGTQSALNNFREMTMTSPNGIAEYIGFTEAEVKMLCNEHRISFSDMQKWYDGYILNKIGHVYSPNSVMEAISNAEFQNYWTKTETYESLKIYIEMDYDGLKQKIVDMLGGVHCKIDVESFQNDLTSFRNADDILTLLIHLGYLAYDSNKEEAFIPNEEVRSTFVRAVRNQNWNDVYEAIQNSEMLLEATLAMDEEKVARMIHSVHTDNISGLVYNNEVSLASVVRLAYYSAAKDYIFIREMPAGEGFADMVLLPKIPSVKPAIIVELKWNKSAQGAIQQIQDKHYPDSLKEYTGNLLLVGINYDKKSRVHTCHIEKQLNKR